ncbi:hypothetical protein [Microvirga pakistanensis]
MVHIAAGGASTLAPVPAELCRADAQCQAGDVCRLGA